MMKASDKKDIDTAIKEKEYNEYAITVKGPRYKIVVNGTTMIDADFPKLPGKDGKPAPAEGIIAFQAHGGYAKMRVEFKDIKFTKLK
jgi:hypothetical protein